LLGLGSAFLYGSWALFANWSTDRAARAALAQAALSFVSTTAFTLFAELLFRLGRDPRRGFWLSALGTVTFIAMAMASIHAVVGTPRIATTIAPSVFFGGIFFTAYAWGLRTAALRKRES
jgi:hypothetical protein